MNVEFDPVLAAISEHQALVREARRLEKSYKIARAKAEKKHGEWTQGEWPGETTISPFYDRWNRACRDESKAAIRMARTEPTTRSGAAALIDHVRCEIDRDYESAKDWVTPALKTVVAALARRGDEEDD
jgi:hypothetical protein